MRRDSDASCMASSRNGDRLAPLAKIGRSAPRALLAWLCFVVAILVPVSEPLISATSHGADLTVFSDGPIRTDQSDRPSIFRLGDAAKPFGWSTVVGDFNTDGAPDVAIADHIGRRTSSYAYRLELAVSGEARRDVTFETSHEAITIRVADIDRDDDLDIIIGTPLSGETVGVWLNDGHGNFTAGDVRQVPATVTPVRSVDVADPRLHFGALDVSPRRAGSSLSAALRAPPVETTYRSADSPGPVRRSIDLSSRTSPRAPPSFPRDALS